MRQCYKNILFHVHVAGSPRQGFGGSVETGLRDCVLKEMLEGLAATVVEESVQFKLKPEAAYAGAITITTAKAMACPIVLGAHFKTPKNPSAFGQTAGDCKRRLL
jgi:hypothetical protein